MEEIKGAIKILEDAGARVTRNVNISSLEAWAKVDKDEKMSLLSADFKTAIELHLKALHDMVVFIKSHPQEEYPSRGIEQWQMAESGAHLQPEELQRRRDQMLRCSNKEGILGALSAWNLDALICPTADKPWITFAAHAGLLVVTAPLGFYPSERVPELNRVP